MSKATQSIDITINVTFADDSEQALKVQVSEELYQGHEFQALLEDTLARAARALNRRIFAAKEGK
jgi:hypothetical protein